MMVSDILRNKKSNRVVTVRMTETVDTAARLLMSEDISALVVKDVCDTEGHVAVGMVTERDIVRAVAEHGTAGLAIKVGALISVQRLVWCGSSDSLDHVRELMRSHHIRHLPVIDDHALVGVISMRDLGLAGGNTDADTAAMPAAFARAPSAPPLTPRQ
jgi:CBS domain-containing protein